MRVSLLMRSCSVLATLVAVLFSPDVWADAPRVEVKVHVIHASNHGSEVDSRLEELRRQLSAFNFSSYRLLAKHERVISFGSTVSVSLPGDRVLVVMPQDRDADGRLRLRLTMGDTIDTTYTIDEGATLIVGGPRLDGGHLILAVNQNAVR